MVGRAKEIRANCIDTRLRQHNICIAKWDSDYDEIEDNCVALVPNSQSLREREPAKCVALVSLSSVW